MREDPVAGLVRRAVHVKRGLTEVRFRRRVASHTPAVGVPFLVARILKIRNDHVPRHLEVIHRGFKAFAFPPIIVAQHRGEMREPLAKGINRFRSRPGVSREGLEFFREE